MARWQARRLWHRPRRYARLRAREHCLPRPGWRCPGGGAWRREGLPARAAGTELVDQLQLVPTQGRSGRPVRPVTISDCGEL